MNRRKFVGQITAGLALQSISASLLAGSGILIPPNGSSLTWLDPAARLIQGGTLGIPQRLTISHIYSPRLTSITDLLDMATRDFGVAGNLLGMELVINPENLLKDASSRFGSYSTCFYRENMAITWLGLARIGRSVSKPNCTLRVQGSLGVLRIDFYKGVQQLVNLRGQRVHFTGPASV